jgi:tRNA-specific 2-thiouridylase
VDHHKDQSYVLSVLSQAQLAHAMFPLGDYTKEHVRDKARALNLPVAERAESQDLCFVGGGDYRDFLEAQGAQLPPGGPIVDRQGKQLGEHAGLARYTIGQRKGIGLSAPVPLYVLEKDLESNSLVVGPRDALGRQEFVLEDVNWIADTPPLEPLTADVRVRYKAREVQALVRPTSASGARIRLSEPLPDVTPGQSAVFYQGELCLGGGVIRA